jgi:hypothetical protein
LLAELTGEKTVEEISKVDRRLARSIYQWGGELVHNQCNQVTSYRVLLFMGLAALLRSLL